MTGGSALNVPLNSAIHRTFGMPVFVSSAPNDAGLALGGAWLATPPPPTKAFHRSSSDAFLGPELWDGGAPALEAAAMAHGATRVVSPSETLAALLAEGKIVAVVRGRSEYGPRALGHRSLLADPTRADTKERLNRIKHREWWRPVAPMVAYETVDEVFEERVWSPYMSFAPRLRPGMAAALPAIAHFDGTARVQTVSRDVDPWLHALLMAFKEKSDFAVLCNTSFNTRGRPIINRLDEALELLWATDDLDYLYVDGWLFSKEDGGVGGGMGGLLSEVG